MRSASHAGLALCVVLLSLLPLLQPGAARADVDFPLVITDSQVEDAVAYLLAAQSSSGDIAGFAVSAWALMALATAGESSAVAGLLSYLEDESDTGSFDATHWARMILATAAAGADPSDFGGEDYVAGLKGTYAVESMTGQGFTQIGDPELLNDDVWGILALVAAGEIVDQDIVDFVQEFQNTDGGWGIDVFSDSDVDITAAAIMALKVVGLSSGSAAVAGGLAFLAGAQNSDGGFPSMPGGASNAASNSWAIQAIVAAGGNPAGSAWQKGGVSPVEHLLSLQHTSGYFRWYAGNSSNQQWMTAYAIPALLGKPYPVPALQSAATNASIARSPLTLAFHATYGGGNPVAVTLHVWNEGAGAMQYTVSSNMDWLALSPSNGSSSGEVDAIAVTVDIAALDAGMYTGTITISSANAGNSPRTMPVSLNVTDPADVTEIAFSPGVLSFTAAKSGGDPASQFFEVWNAGPGVLPWEVDVDEDWLSVSPSSGSSSGEHDKVTVAVDIADLDAGDYEATVTISSDDADNSPRTLTVALTVTGSSSTTKPQITYSPSTFTFDAVEGGDDPAGTTLQVWNGRSGRLDWVVSADADWLSLSPRSGTSNGEKDDVSVSVNISGLEPDTYSARITIADDDDSGNRATVRVTLTVGAAAPVVQAAETYLLVATVSPDGAGTISRSVSAGADGYGAGTTVALTATALTGYAFAGWFGDAGGTSPTTTVVMDNHRSVVASFLKFDKSGVTSIRLAYASADLTGLTILPYPVESIPSSPPGFRLLSAYVVQPEGAGSFALEFDDLVDADNVALFQVMDGAWLQVPRTVLSESCLQVTLPVADTVIVLAYPGSSSFGAWQRFTGFFGSMDSTTMIIIAVLGVLAMGVVAVIGLLLRRHSY